MLHPSEIAFFRWQYQVINDLQKGWFDTSGAESALPDVSNQPVHKPLIPIELVHLLMAKFRWFNGLHSKQFPYGSGWINTLLKHKQVGEGSLLQRVKFPYGRPALVQSTGGSLKVHVKQTGRGESIEPPQCGTPSAAGESFGHGILPPYPSPFVHSTPLCPSHVPVRQKSRC